MLNRAKAWMCMYGRESSLGVNQSHRSVEEWSHRLVVEHTYRPSIDQSLRFGVQQFHRLSLERFPCLSLEAMKPGQSCHLSVKQSRCQGAGALLPYS